MEDLMRKAYDRFDLDVQSVQVIFAPEGKN